MSTEIFIANSDEEIESCFPVYLELRPHLVEENFLSQVRRQRTQSFQIVGVRLNGAVVSAVGFREAEYLMWGKVIYIDDLTTLGNVRGKGYARLLLDWVVDYARSRKVNSVHLDTGYGRHAAHRLYLNNGFQISCHHLSLELAA
jgi:GNAT superfamily N-acetyltransferase